MRQLLLGEITNGTATTVGELLDKLEKATPSDRRQLLDAARERAGLKSIERLEFEARHAQAQRNGRARATRKRTPPLLPRLKKQDGHAADPARRGPAVRSAGCCEPRGWDDGARRGRRVQLGWRVRAHLGGAHRAIEPNGTILPNT